MLLAQFFLDFLTESKKKKRFFGGLVLLIGLCSIWIGFNVQKAEKKEADNRHKQENIYLRQQFRGSDSIIHALENSNTLLSSELKLRNQDLFFIRRQNDSLKNQLFSLSEKQDKSLVLSQFSAQEVSKSRVALENLGYKQISRDISETERKEMIKVLNGYVNGTVTITSILGDSESLQFAKKIKEIFEAAGWKVNGVNQAVFTNPIEGIHLEIKTAKFPLKPNIITNAFRVLNIIVHGHLNQNLDFDDAQLIIGSHK